MKLWEIGVKLDAIGMVLVENGGVLGSETEKRLDDMEGEFSEKVTRIVLLVQEMEGDAEAAKGQEQRLKGIRKAYEASAKRLKLYAQHCMGSFDHPSIKTSRARVRIQRNTQPSVRVIQDDLDKLPERFIKTTRTLDKSAVLLEWEQSSPDPDARTNPEGFEIEWGSHLRIF